jgi:hypothetical protein
MSKKNMFQGIEVDGFAKKINFEDEIYSHWISGYSYVP